MADTNSSLNESNELIKNIQYNIALKILNEYVCCNIYFRLEGHHENRRKLIESGDINGMIAVNRYIQDQIKDHQRCYWLTVAVITAIEDLEEILPNAYHQFELSKMALIN